MKKLIFLLLGIVSIFSLVSCDEEEPPIVDNPPVETPGDEEKNFIDMTDDSALFSLKYISIDTTNAKTDFYLGEEFSSEGIVVKAYYEDDNSTEPTQESKIVTHYSVDTEFVNMSKTGRYPVKIIYRDGIQTTDNTYYINVGRSYLAESGYKYLAGISTDIKEIKLNLGEEFVMPTVAVTANYMVGSEIVETKTVPGKALKVDSSSVNPNKRGTYIIKYTLEDKYISEVKKNADGIYEETGNKKEHKIVESVFVLVHVLNPVKSIEFVSGTTNQNATVLGLDCSDWKFKVNFEIGDPEEITYNSNDFELLNVNSIVPGDYSAMIIYTNDGVKVTTNVDVSIKESVNSQIITCLKFGENQGVSNRMSFDEAGYFYGTGGSSGTEIKNKDDGYIFDGITFAGYLKLGGAGTPTKNNLEVNMTTSGTIVIYFKSTGADVRYLNMYDSNGVILDTYASSEGKLLVDVEEAGTYYFASQASGMYIYGCILSLDITE